MNDLDADVKPSGVHESADTGLKFFKTFVQLDESRQ